MTAREPSDKFFFRSSYLPIAHNSMYIHKNEAYRVDLSRSTPKQVAQNLYTTEEMHMSDKEAYQLSNYIRSYYPKVMKWNTGLNWYPATESNKRVPVDKSFKPTR